MSCTFQLGIDIGVPVTRMRGASAGRHAVAGRHARLELVGDLVDHLREARHVVVEGDLDREEGVLARDGRGPRRPAGVQALQRAALVVDLADGGPQLSARRACGR